jgi:MFS family permease
MAVVQALVRVRGKDFSPVMTGVVVGAVDGACFLGLAGTALGIAAGYWVWDKSPWFAEGVWGVSWLIVGAIFFGFLAYGLVGTGSRVVAPIFLGALVGTLAGYLAAGSRGLFFGALGGALLGGIGGILLAGSGRSRFYCPPKDDKRDSRSIRE